MSNEQYAGVPREKIAGKTPDKDAFAAIWKRVVDVIGALLNSTVLPGPSTSGWRLVTKPHPSSQSGELVVSHKNWPDIYMKFGVEADSGRNWVFEWYDDATGMSWQQADKTPAKALKTFRKQLAHRVKTDGPYGNLRDQVEQALKQVQGLRQMAVAVGDHDVVLRVKPKSRGKNTPAGLFVELHRLDSGQYQWRVPFGKPFFTGPANKVVAAIVAHFGQVVK